jgi:cyclopropane fatty-acyl-phospholipid synthase-like methyltransferase
MSLSAGYFEAMYASDPDPWGFTSRWYERRKYALTLAALPRARYRSAFEPGCSIGVLSEQLAPRCDRLLCTDVVPAAVASATDRLRDQPHVTVERRALPDGWPDGPFDLIVLSEVGYYLGVRELPGTLERAARSLEPQGDLVAVHWRHLVPEYPQTGDAVHEALAATGGLHRIARHDERDFLLEVYTRTPPRARSVAEREGLC